ncbi:MAG: hypothetical protein AAFR22_19645 [Chloroflexota bacterium]
MKAIHTLTVSPSGQHIAYLKGQPERLTLGLLDTLNPDHEPVELWTDLRCSQPYMAVVWNADSTAVYIAKDNDNWFHDVWRVDVKTHKTTSVTGYFHTNTYPIMMHPKRPEMLCMSDLRGELNVRLLNLDSGEMRKITDYATPVKTAVYSPDGGQIAYTANATDNQHNADMYIMNADGFNKRKELSTLAGTFDIVRAWSSNGRFLAVDSNFEGGWRSGIYDLRNASLKWFTPAWEKAQALGFSPDSKHLLINTENGVAIYETRSARPHTISSVTANHAVWLDNNQVVFTTGELEIGVYSMKTHRVELFNMKSASGE